MKKLFEQKENGMFSYKKRKLIYLVEQQQIVDANSVAIQELTDEQKNEAVSRLTPSLEKAKQYVFNYFKNEQVRNKILNMRQTYGEEVYEPNDSIPVAKYTSKEKNIYQDQKQNTFNLIDEILNNKVLTAKLVIDWQKNLPGEQESELDSKSEAEPNLTLQAFVDPKSDLVYVPYETYLTNLKSLDQNAFNKQYFATFSHELTHHIDLELVNVGILPSIQNFKSDVFADVERAKKIADNSIRNKMTTQKYSHQNTISAYNYQPGTINYNYGRNPREHVGRMMELRIELGLPAGNISKEQLIEGFRKRGIDIVQTGRAIGGEYGIRFKRIESPSTNSFTQADNQSLMDDFTRQYYPLLGKFFRSLKFLLFSMFTGFRPDRSPNREYNIFGFDIDKLLEYNNDLLAANQQAQTSYTA